nr:unnamed protein product [Digitaria exilis]
MPTSVIRTEVPSGAQGPGNDRARAYVAAKNGNVGLGDFPTERENSVVKTAAEQISSQQERPGSKQDKAV